MEDVKGILVSAPVFIEIIDCACNVLCVESMWEYRSVTHTYLVPKYVCLCVAGVVVE